MKKDYESEELKEFAKRAEKILNGDTDDKPATFEQSLESTDDPETRKIIIEAYLGKPTPN